MTVSNFPLYSSEINRLRSPGLSELGQRQQDGVSKANSQPQFVILLLTSMFLNLKHVQMVSFKTFVIRCSQVKPPIMFIRFAQINLFQLTYPNVIPYFNKIKMLMLIKAKKKFPKRNLYCTQLKHTYLLYKCNPKRQKIPRKSLYQRIIV